MTSTATVAVIGGSGLYSLFDPAESTAAEVTTPYGVVGVTVGDLGGRPVAFITRHGSDHSVPPHLINYRANIWALASLGVKVIISSSAVGGIGADCPPGTIVLTDQFIDRTWGRPDTFYDRGSAQHLPAADPFDPELHAIAAEALAAAGETFAERGTVVVIQGPRFSTRAESLWFRGIGATTVNMTMYPEVPLASELNIATANLSFVTDTDAGLAPAADPENEVSHQLVLERLLSAQPRIVAAIETIVRALPADFAGRELIPAAEVAAVLARTP
jgi:5'-methylthioadenosine phosphorylase